MKKYFDEYFDMVYFINLPNRTDRYENVMKMFKVLDINNYKHILPPPGIKPCIINGVDVGEDNDNLSLISCKLAHIKTLQDAVDNGYKKVMIFEDDITFNQENSSILNDLEYHLNACFNFLKNNEWGMFYFDNVTYMHKDDRQIPLGFYRYPLIKDYPHVLKLDRGKTSAHCYSLNGDAIEKMLNLHLSNGRVLDHNYRFNAIDLVDIFTYTPGIFDQLLNDKTDVFWTNHKL